MGMRNKERRAAKARSRRQQARREGPAGGYEPPPPPPPIADMLAMALFAAAEAHAAGDPTARDECAANLTGPWIAGMPGLVEVAVQRALDDVIAAVWAGGWLPVDLRELARRRLDTAAAGYLVDAVAAQVRRYGEGTLHPLWREQLDEIGARVWWSPEAPLLGQWAAGQGLSRSDALATAIEVLAMLVVLPEVPRILPPPGSAAAGAATRRSGVDSKVLGRVRALLAKAESTEFPEEAEALSAKAQELMTRHALERALVAADDRGPRRPVARRLWLEAPYVGAKGLLVDAVAAANRCRSLLSEKLGFATVVGDEVDLEFVELLTTSLLVQASRAMLATGRHVTRSGQSRTRSFRQSFLIAYAGRIRERLGAARDAGTAAVDDPERLLPVLAARRRVIDEAVEELFGRTVEKAFAVTNAAGWHAGRTAADLALLDVGRSVAAGG